MNYNEIKEIVMKRINENKLTAVFDSHDKINVANGVVIITTKSLEQFYMIPCIQNFYRNIEPSLGMRLRNWRMLCTKHCLKEMASVSSTK